MKKKFRGYIFSRPFFGERAPQHVQNLVIKDYCEQKDYLFLLSFTEYRMSNSTLMLQSLLKDLKKIDGIVFFSLFQLPENQSFRMKLLKKILKQKKEIHFAVEKIIFNNESQLELVENLFSLKKLSNYQEKNFEKIKNFLI
tara:strand:- start:249 stop:671 length:423 start_codon:yes stop_codon:yes gene_type:complete